jgi:hypothetical protein
MRRPAPGSTREPTVRKARSQQAQPPHQVSRCRGRAGALSCRRPQWLAGADVASASRNLLEDWRASRAFIGMSAKRARFAQPVRGRGCRLGTHLRFRLGFRLRFRCRFRSVFGRARHSRCKSGSFPCVAWCDIYTPTRIRAMCAYSRVSCRRSSSFSSLPEAQTSTLASQPDNLMAGAAGVGACSWRWRTHGCKLVGRFGPPTVVNPMKAFAHHGPARPSTRSAPRRVRHVETPSASREPIPQAALQAFEWALCGVDGRTWGEMPS